MSPSRRLTAVRRCSGARWAYRIVMVSEAWPSSSFTVTLRMTAQDATVCRSVWKFTSSSLAASTALLYAVWM